MSETLPEEIWQGPTQRIGRCVQVYRELPSTNTWALSLPESEAKEGLVIIARHQTAGRGRYGRVWQSQPDQSLLMSVILQPPSYVKRPVILTAWAAVAMADAIFQLTRRQVRIKWPNDLLLAGKKISGILIEGGRQTIVGIGLNLNQTGDDFASAQLPDATSLRMATGQSFDLKTVAMVALQCLDAEYARLLGDDPAVLEADWKWRIGLLGRVVSLHRTDGSIMQGRLLEMSFEKLELQSDGTRWVSVMPETVAHIVPADGH